MTSNKYKFLLFGIGFGLLFPLLGSALVCLEEGCEDGVIAMHQKLRLMQIIDLAPFVLGAFSFLLGMNVDRRMVSERKAQEATAEKAALQAELAAQLQLQNDELRALNATLDGLVYTASHDLKTPVINFESMLKMLRQVKEEPGSEKMVDEIIKRMEAATQRFHATIRDLLEVSRVERQEEMKEIVQLSSLLQELQDHLSEFLNEAGTTVTLEIEANELLASKTFLNSIFQNLITNAVKYRHPDRAPMIQVRSRYVGGDIEVKVIDNGSGIDLAKQGDKVFQMFTRFQSGGEGSGIGLYIVKRTVTKMGGSIDIESNPGEGTTFTILFPRTFSE